MEKFTLEILFHIIGIGAASGLIFKDQKLYIISDNSSYLYEYQMDSKDLKKHELLPNPTENTPKKDKADFESITEFQDNIYVFGSGSSAKRNKMILFNLQQNKKSQTNDLGNLYTVMQNFASIAPEDFNIEASAYNGQNWYFLNRGNGPNSRNTLFHVEARKLDEEFKLMSNDYKLPKIKGVRCSFTDAVLVENKLYFLATAEKTTSTYKDGEILGSLIGRIDLETMKIDFTKKISAANKFEGLTVFKIASDKIQFLLCEDGDSNNLQSTIYKLTLNKR
ncbi:DUF6929 family protein [Flavobacterium daejeonense]|uniref:DUF6929 family protein n=1 Tax=Flavobacterium daejeonense TaxID=350893 RepID=UPI00047BC961|nr:hypothetical protein [Flavobacterium daejeonense]